MLKLKNYTLKFENKMIFDNTCFKANHNQLTLIIGESGVGKTTCLHSLKLDNIYNGEYTYNQKKVTRKMLQEHFCYIEQFPFFIEDLDITSHFLMINENFYKEDIYSTLDKLKINPLLRKYPNQLSDGEKKRVSLSLAFFMNKDILIIDEPTSSLNEEFSKIVCELLKQYVKTGHMVIASSHDHLLKEYADVIYKIEYNQFQCIKDREEHNIQIDNKNNVKIRIKISDYFKMYRHYLRSHLIIKLFMMFLVSVIGFAFVFNNKAIQINIETMNKISSTEILVFKNIDGNDLFDYSYSGEEFPFSKEEVKALKNINHVSYINYKYDINICNDCDENTSLGTRNIDNTLEKLSAKQYGKKLIVNYPDNFNNNTITMQTYDSKYNYETKIKERVSKEKGIYISNSLFNILFKNAKNYDSLTLYFPIQVPIYNVSGITSTQSENGDAYYEANCVATKEVWIELPIIGILSDNSLYDNYNNVIGSYDIFLDQDILEKYIEQNKDTKNHTIYYTGEFGSSKKYYDKLPPKNEKIRQTISMNPWSPNCYIMRLDNLGYLDDILTQINKFGFDAKNMYVNSSSLKNTVSSVQNVSRVLAAGITILLLLIGFSTKSKEKNEIMTNQFLKNMGIGKKEIQKIKLRKYFVHFIIQTTISLIVSFVLLNLFNIILSSSTKYSLILVLIVICLHFVIEFLFAIIMERKWLMDVSA